MVAVGYYLRVFGIVSLCLAGFAEVSIADDGAGSYRISPGDRLELRVVGLPELSQKALVDTAGDVPLPMLGAVPVGGLTLAQVQDKVRTALSGKIVYRRSPEGKKIPHIADADEILVEIAEYRPVYVTGDVPRPGEQPFRPGLRVRQALALAGGQDALTSRLGAGFLNAFDYRSGREAALLEYGRERLQFWRIGAELADQDKLPVEDIRQRLPQMAGIDTLLASEAEILTLRAQDWAKEKRYLQQSVEQATLRVKTLADQYSAESKGSAADADEFGRMQKLLEKNLTSQNRVTDARRAMLISATRELQINVQLATAERDREERARAMVRTIDQRRALLVKERSETALRIAQLTARIDANDKKLVFLSGLSATTTAEQGPAMRITIKRSGAAGSQSLVADEDTILHPGDTIEVRVRQRLDIGEPEQ